MTREELIDGEIYICDSKIFGDFLMKSKGDNSSTFSINFIHNHFSKYSCFSNNSTIQNNFEYSEATPEQKHWLNCCIEADKFIPYDEAMKTFVKEFVLPKYYTVEVTSDEEFHIVRRYMENDFNDRFKLENHKNYNAFKFNNVKNYYIGYYKDGSLNFYNSHYYDSIHGDIITFKEFEQYVLKENKLSYKILKQEGDKILQVENEEGSVFDIDDSVKSLLSNQKGKITGFRYNTINFIEDPNKASVIALTDFQKRGISINKIEHYIEPKEDKFVLPEIWWCRVTEENQEMLSKWRHGDLNYKRYPGELVGICRYDGKLEKGHNPVTNISSIGSSYAYNFGNEITTEQFKEHVLGIKPETKIQEMVKGQAELDLGMKTWSGEDIVEESLLDKAKRLYPVGTKFRSAQNNTIYTVKGGYRLANGLPQDEYLFVEIEENENWLEYLMFRSQWAEITEPVDNSKYEILSFKSSSIDSNGNLSRRQDDGTHIWDTDTYPKGINEEQLLEDKYLIISVKQLSTGNIFTVGDEICILNFYSKRNIKSIRITENNYIQFILGSAYGTDDSGYNQVLMQNCTK